MGVVILLLMIIVVLCVVILCMRRSHRKRDKKVLYNINKPNTNVAINNNPSCNVIKANTVDHEYSTIKPEGSYVSLLPPHDATTHQIINMIILILKTMSLSYIPLWQLILLIVQRKFTWKFMPLIMMIKKMIIQQVVVNQLYMVLSISQKIDILSLKMLIMASYVLAKKFIIMYITVYIHTCTWTSMQCRHIEIQIIKLAI